MTGAYQGPDFCEAACLDWHLNMGKWVRCRMRARAMRSGLRVCKIHAKAANFYAYETPEADRPKRSRGKSEDRLA